MYIFIQERIKTLSCCHFNSKITEIYSVPQNCKLHEEDVTETIDNE